MQEKKNHQKFTLIKLIGIRESQKTKVSTGPKQTGWCFQCTTNYAKHIMQLFSLYLEGDTQTSHSSLNSFIVNSAKTLELMPKSRYTELRFGQIHTSLLTQTLKNYPQHKQLEEIVLS